MKFNDLDMKAWKNSDIDTDSLWLINARDKSGKHKNVYHGNFVPQIAHQLISRYTKRGEIVLDAFVGSGTSMYECENLGRKGIGLDINAEILGFVSENLGVNFVNFTEDLGRNFALNSQQNELNFTRNLALNSSLNSKNHAQNLALNSSQNYKNSTQNLALNLSQNSQQNSAKNSANFALNLCDNTNSNQVHLALQKSLQNLGAKSVQLVIFHPPYMDIVKFTQNPRDLSSISDLREFLNAFLKSCENSLEFLDKNRYFAVVIGDVYKHSEVVPLGFYTLDAIKRRFKVKLKGIIVKNIEGNRGKLKSQNIWRYRALSSDYYIFKHEYILVFKKEF